MNNNIKTKSYVIASRAKQSRFLTGAASLYVVIFTTLLLGIITLGFIRIMLSEAIQTSETDLSQSAFDSALAGVEDAKVALLKYHECVSTNSSTPECKNIIDNMRAENASSNCDIVREILHGRVGEHETIIQSTDTAGGVGAEMEQAYTCVLISENNSNYLGQLNHNYHSKMIPLRTTNVNEVNYVRVDWFSGANAQTADRREANSVTPNSTLSTSNKPSGYKDTANSGLFPVLNSTDPSMPPVIGVQLFQTDVSFSLTDLNTNNDDNTNRGALYLTPYPSPSPTSTIDIIENSINTGFAASSDKAINLPVPIRCQPNDNSDALYFCSAILRIPKPYQGGNRNEGAAFLRIFLPYGTPATDFSIALCRTSSCREEADFMPFVGVQARIDATGRANDLFRRVESRIELVDVYFPFPEYAAAISPSLATDDAISKNFWVTKNNWGYANSEQIP